MRMALAMTVGIAVAVLLAGCIGPARQPVPANVSNATINETEVSDIEMNLTDIEDVLADIQELDIEFDLNETEIV